MLLLCTSAEAELVQATTVPATDETVLMQMTTDTATASMKWASPWPSMSGWVWGWVDGWMDRWVGGWMDRWGSSEDSQHYSAFPSQNPTPHTVDPETLLTELCTLAAYTLKHTQVFSDLGVIQPNKSKHVDVIFWSNFYSDLNFTLINFRCGGSKIMHKVLKTDYTFCNNSNFLYFRKAKVMAPHRR